MFGNVLPQMAVKHKYVQTHYHSVKDRVGLVLPLGSQPIQKAALVNLKV